MKILITGANGMLAKAVRERFKDHELILTDVAELDITDLDAVVKFVEETKPEYIINCAAYTAVDKAEEQEDLAKRINGDGPKNLAIAAEKFGATLVHISTDYVFPGDLPLEKCYVEDDATGPVTAYGRTKLLGEKGVKENCNKYYIFRISWLFGDGKNFVKTMMELGKTRDFVKVVSDQNGNPTYAVDVANVIADAIDKKIPYGLYHATNQGETTWYEFTKLIFKLTNIDCEVQPVTTAEFASAATRPANSKLSKEKLLATGIKVANYEDALKRYLATLQ